jgi:hypothetical protein
MYSHEADTDHAQADDYDLLPVPGCHGVVLAPARKGIEKETTGYHV